MKCCFNNHRNRLQSIMIYPDVKIQMREVANYLYNWIYMIQWYRYFYLVQHIIFSVYENQYMPPIKTGWAKSTLADPCSSRRTEKGREVHKKNKLCILNLKTCWINQSFPYSQGCIGESLLELFRAKRSWMELIGMLPTRCNWITDRLFRMTECSKMREIASIDFIAD